MQIGYLYNQNEKLVISKQKTSRTLMRFTIQKMKVTKVTL